MSNGQVLLLIAAFLILTVGSFIWYVATWDGRGAANTPSTGGKFFVEKFSPLTDESALS